MPKMTIDGREVEFGPECETVLDVARSAGIYIPTLCDHDELEPYGGCRLCIVEIEGLRGYVPACTTAAKDGMVVRTATEELMRLKKEILQLLLIEHPSACLVCAEWPACLQYRTQAYRAGRVTGCNTCPRRDDCELREVVEHIGITGLDYTPEYRDIPVERSDPFYDRDYNLCVLCARCVRVCQEVRGTGAITFVKRGHETRVDTAFGTSHVDCGCWFCGACIDVCPTGALYPRLSKWVGMPESEEVTTCMLCGTGCQFRADIKWGKVMATGPAPPDSAPNGRHLCVLGRFCIPPLVNAGDRLRAPHVRRDGEMVPVSWDEALQAVVEGLKGVPPGRIAVLGGPHLTTEAAYLLQKLARVALGTPDVASRGCEFASLVYRVLGADGALDRVAQLEDISRADWIVSLGGDFVESHQVVAKTVYGAVRRGVPLVHIGQPGKNLRRWTVEDVLVDEPVAPAVVRVLVEGSGAVEGVPEEQLRRVIDIVSQGRGVVLVGPRVLELDSPSDLLRDVLRLLGDDGRLVPLFLNGNEAGVVRAGAVHDMLPGPASVAAGAASYEEKWGRAVAAGADLGALREKARAGQVDAVIVLDGSIPVDGFEGVPFIVYQSPFPSPWLEHASVVLASAMSIEESGTMVNHEFREQALKAVVPPPGEARPDWEVLAELARRMGAAGFEYGSPGEVWDELAGLECRVGPTDTAAGDAWQPVPREETEWYPRYRGATLAERIEDLAVLIEALPGRRAPPPTESLEDMMREAREKWAARTEEV